MFDILDTWADWERCVGRVVPADLAGFTPPGIPPWLEDLPTGPLLAEALESIDMTSVDAAERVTVLRCRRRLVSHHQARLHEDVDRITEEYSDEDPALAFDAAASEVRAALRLTRRAAERLVDVASDLTTRLPALGDSLRSGDLDLARARVIAERTAHLPDDAARAVCIGVLDRAPRCTTGQLRALVDRACLEVDPDAAKVRHRRAVADRSLTSEMNDDGTVTLTAWNLPPARAAFASDRIDRIARSLRHRGETRTMDQLRADVFVDLLTGGDDTHSATLHISVDLATLSDLTEYPGHLDGYGPIAADIARQVARGATTITWSVDDPATAQPIATGTTRRRPDAAQTRHVRASHPTCVFPGCRMPAVSCDIDHTTPWAGGGPTETDNLAPLCRHDHLIRHRLGWRYTTDRHGDHVWTSPLGHLSTTSGRDP